MAAASVLTTNIGRVYKKSGLVLSDAARKVVPNLVRVEQFILDTPIRITPCDNVLFLSKMEAYSSDKPDKVEYTEVKLKTPIDGLKSFVVSSQGRLPIENVLQNFNLLYNVEDVYYVKNVNGVLEAFLDTKISRLGINLNLINLVEEVEYVYQGNPTSFSSIKMVDGSTALIMGSI